MSDTAPTTTSSTPRGPVLAIIGDMVASRTVPDRENVQTTLSDALSRVNAHPAGIASPYTLTLGDEFQAVLTDARRAFHDAVHLQAAVHPVLVRFSLGIGGLTTPVNPHQALGMDGPAFHRARNGIDILKDDHTLLFQLSGLDDDITLLGNASLNLISHAFGKWHTRRFHILDALQQDLPVPEIARRLEVSEQAVYKNISDGRLRDVMQTFRALSRFINQALER